MVNETIKRLIYATGIIVAIGIGVFGFCSRCDNRQNGDTVENLIDNEREAQKTIEYLRGIIQQIRIAKGADEQRIKELNGTIGRLTEIERRKAEDNRRFGDTNTELANTIREQREAIQEMEELRNAIKDTLD